MTESFADFINRKNKEFNEKESRMKDIGRKGCFYFKKEAWTFMPQSNLSEKVFVLERLRHTGTKGKITWKDAKSGIEYRLGYYIVGKIGKRKGKWVWGQFCPLIPEKDFKKLIKKAKKEGTLRNL